MQIRMPELPEVETMRRGILPIVGAAIERVARPPCRKKPIAITPRVADFSRRTRDRTIADVQRLGKRVVVVLGDDQRIVFEPRMTGLVLIDEPPNREHLRFDIQLDSPKHPHLYFWDRRGLGLVRLFRPAEFAKQFANGRLGPDALQISEPELRGVFAKLKSPVKVALLDQRRVAGIGNLYAAEILHLAQVHPATACCRLSPPQWSAIYQAMLKILRAAIRAEGSTLSDGTYRNALNQPGEYQNLHRVYDRAGQRCLTCRQADILRIVQAQRATFFCPHCQTRAGKKKI